MSNIRVIDVDDLKARVCFEDLIDPISDAFQASSAGLAENGFILMTPDQRPDLGDVYVKTGTLAGHDVFVVKVAPWFAANVVPGGAQGGFIGVFDSKTGHTIAILDEQHYLSDIRTAAAGALAARALAPAVVDVAAVIGSGTQAYWQPQALYGERPFKTLLIWARSPARAHDLKRRLREKLPAVQMLIVCDLESTIRGADVIMTTTQAREPIVRGEWLRAGQHITAVGADDATKCELDAAALQRSRVFVDSFEASAASGDIHRAIGSGDYALSNVCGELGQVLAGTAPGRRSDLDITVAKFVGIGVQDLVAAEVSLRLIDGRATTFGGSAQRCT